MRVKVKAAAIRPHANASGNNQRRDRVVKAWMMVLNGNTEFLNDLFLGETNPLSQKTEREISLHKARD
jgi:hypothetical protein